MPKKHHRDLDFIVASKSPDAITEFFCAHPFVEGLIARGPTMAADGKSVTGSMHIVDLADADPAGVLSKVALVPQDYTRWPLAARENITLGHEARRGPFFNVPAALTSPTRNASLDSSSASQLSTIADKLSGKDGSASGAGSFGAEPCGASRDDADIPPSPAWASTAPAPRSTSIKLSPTRPRPALCSYTRMRKM